MKVFISYSLNDSEQYVLSVLAKKMKEQGYIVSTSFSSSFNVQANQSFAQINNSNLFIGLLTVTGNANGRVTQEWNHAKSKNIPSLLLIENRVQINPAFQRDPNIVVFDRYNPEPSIETVRQKIAASKQIQQTDNNESAWIIGGLAILALIGLLARDDR